MTLTLGCHKSSCTHLSAYMYTYINASILIFKVISLLVSEKKIFMVFTIYGHGGHLGHVTWTV